MTKRIVIIEGISPKGHIEFNKKIIEYLNDSVYEVFIGESINKQYHSFNSKAFDDSFVSKSRLSHAVGFLRAMYNIYKATKMKNIDAYLLLSYDILTLFIISNYGKLVGINIIVCEHNTIPTNLTKKCLQKLSRNVSRICFMPSVANIYREIGCNVLLTKLPLPEYLKKEDIQESPMDYIFCPSASSDEKRIVDVAKKNPKLKFLLKSKNSYDLENLSSKAFFDDYIECLSNCLAAYIPMKTKHRVSGPLHDAVSLGKQVILPPGELFDFAIATFPNNIIEESQLKNNYKFKNFYVNVENFNKEIGTEIRSFVYNINEVK